MPTRRLNWTTVWLALLLGAWALSALGTYWLSQSSGQDIILCPLRRYTGVPCPTCGGTRAAVALATLHPMRALAFNPLVTVALVVVPLWALRRWTKGHSPIDWFPSRRVVWFLLALLMLNWAYVLWHQYGAALALRHN